VLIYMETDHPNSTDEIREAKDVARRCIVLYAVIAAGHGEPRQKLREWLLREGLWDYVSPQEQVFLESNEPSEEQLNQATWRVEALFQLLWALRSINDLPAPTELVDVEFVQSVLPPLFGSTSAFISSAHLRPDSEVHDASGKMFHIHWRIRDAKAGTNPSLPEPAVNLKRLPRMDVKPEQPPVEAFNAGIVFERHHALNWLIGYCGQEWDDITTDT
jgi:hypothetical protein